jgi:hypothetical protein
MMSVLSIILAILTLDAAAASEFSVRCEGAPRAAPYFVTFDTNSRRVVFESAPISPAQPDGSNLFAGEINGPGDTADGQLSFVLNLSRDLLSFRFDTKRNKMIWPGLDDPYRRTLTHSCVVMPPRSILSFRSADPIVRPVSVQCEKAGSMHFTMDPVSKKAIFEREGAGSIYEGKVTSTHGDDVDMLMNWQGWSGQVSWNRTAQTLVMETIDDNRQRSQETLSCSEVTPRTMLEYYKTLRPR